MYILLFHPPSPSPSPVSWAVFCILDNWNNYTITVGQNAWDWRREVCWHFSILDRRDGRKILQNFAQLFYVGLSSTLSPAHSRHNSVLPVGFQEYHNLTVPYMFVLMFWSVLQCRMGHVVQYLKYCQRGSQHIHILTGVVTVLRSSSRSWMSWCLPVSNSSRSNSQLRLCSSGSSGVWSVLFCQWEWLIEKLVESSGQIWLSSATRGACWRQ